MSYLWISLIGVIVIAVFGWVLRRKVKAWYSALLKKYPSLEKAKGKKVGGGALVLIAAVLVFMAIRWIWRSYVVKAWAWASSLVYADWTGSWNWFDTWMNPAAAVFIKVAILLFAAFVLVLFLYNVVIEARKEFGGKTKEKEKKKVIEDPSLSPEEAKLKRQRSKNYQLWPYCPVPQGHSVYMYRWFFGRMGCYKIKDGSCWKIPLFSVARIVNGLDSTWSDESDKIPAGTISSAVVTGEKTSTQAERAGAEIERQRGSRIGSTISYMFRIKASLGQGEELWPLVNADPRLSDLNDTETRALIKADITARIGRIIRSMPWEAAYYLDPLPMLLGDEEEARGDTSQDKTQNPLTGAERYNGLYTKAEYKLKHICAGVEKEVNLFKIKLGDEAQVRVAVEKRPDSLLADLRRQGYRVKLLNFPDRNAPDAVEDEQEKRVLAQIRRESRMTELQSEYVDTARANADGRNLLLEQTIKGGDDYVDMYIRQYGKFHDGALPDVSIDTLIDYNKFNEEWRRKAQIAEEAANYVYIDSGGNAGLSESERQAAAQLRAFIAAQAAGVTPKPKGSSESKTRKTTLPPSSKTEDRGKSTGSSTSNDEDGDEDDDEPGSPRYE